MKILFISHRIPYPPNKGDKLRSFHIIKYLAERHDVCLVSLYDDKKDKQYMTELERVCRKAAIFYINPVIAKLRGIFWSLFLNRPASLGYFYSLSMRLEVNKLINAEGFDLIFAYSSTSAQYVMNAPVKKIMDFVDCDSAKWRQYSKVAPFPLSWLYEREYKALRKYEAEVARRFDRSVVVAEPEKNEFAEFTCIEKFVVVNNGVDLSYFSPAETSIPNRLIFTGAMDYLANIDGVVLFCGEVLPLVKKRIPVVEFHIIGPRPARAIRSLAKQNGVFVTGEVKDIKAYLITAAVSVTPSFRIAQGLQNKILEAMACAIPVVTTSGALAGLKAVPGKDILAADTYEEFADKIIMLLENGELRKKIGENARKYVEENHSWERNLSKLEAALSVGTLPK